MDSSKNLLFKPISFKRILKIVAGIVFVVTVVAYWSGVVNWLNSDESTDSETVSSEEEGHNCNVAGIELHGGLVTYVPVNRRTEDESANQDDESASEDIIGQINTAEADDAIKAILLEIDSSGGSPVAAEEVEVALKTAKKPTIALIRESGISAAYWAATGANVIFASANSDVGSIGVTQSYLDSTNKNQKEGLVFQELSTGKYKDIQNPDKPLTADERVLIQRDLAIVYDNFIKAVADNRHMSIDAVRALADGSSMMGSMAVEKGLVDKIGGLDEAKSYMKEKIGEEPDICW